MTHCAEPLSESTPDDRARLVVRMAVRVFGDATRAADWLIQTNDALGGQSPLFIAKDSMVGCARVCQALGDMIQRSSA
jgi:uncharacterized protein (DUF2384 family)